MRGKQGVFAGAKPFRRAAQAAPAQEDRETMSEIRRGARPPVASAEEDPNATIICSSPPCFLHELDPSYLGYLGREEVFVLLAALLAAEWDGIVSDEARFHAVLRRHLEALGDGPDRTPGASRAAAVSGSSAARAEPPDRGPNRLVRMIREALPRLHGDALRRDLEEVLGALERGIQHRDGLPGRR